jgi:translocation and assembly module TamA
MLLFSARQCLTICLGFLLLSILSSKGHAALDDLPFIGDKFPFSISVENQPQFSKPAEQALRTQRDESPEFRNINQQRSAARFDRTVIMRWLHSEGFYAAVVNTRFEENRIRHQVLPGARYRVKEITMDLPSEIKVPKRTDLAVIEGAPLRAADVLKMREQLRQYVLDHYCLYQVDVSYEVLVDHNSGTANLSYRLAPSPAVRFGEPQVAEIPSVRADYLRHYFTFNAGDCFKRKDLDQTRLQLLQTNLLSRVEIGVGEPVEGVVPVSFAFAPRNHRTLKAGAGYDSDIGAGVILGWQHRNLFHRGENLDIETELAEIERNLKAELKVPHFRRKDQTLTLHSELSHEIPDAYEATSAEAGFDLSRALTRTWTASLGTTLEFSRMNENEQKDDFALLYFPLSLDYLGSNDLLEPTRGWTLGLKSTPFVDIYNAGTRFVKSQLAASIYLTGDQWSARPTLALRAATGTITGADLAAVPVAHRYYVGGGGSVRGYAYQTVGELTDAEPDGGLAFGETSLELRLRLTESWGLVLFTDGGYAYPGETPRFGDDFLWGAGFGIRYFTSFAPLRLDIATPLDKRTNSEGKAIDDSVQIYISLGQAF